MIKLIFLIFLCLVPGSKADALSFGDFGKDTIVVAKALKLGRGTTYSSGALGQQGGGFSTKACPPASCGPGQYWNESSCGCSSCPNGEDCGCKAAYGINSVSRDGSCGCPQDFFFSCAPGQQQNYKKCGCDPCPEGQNCDCSYRYGETYVADGKGGCKNTAITCPVGKYLSYFGEGCIACPALAKCNGTVTWEQYFAEFSPGSGCGNSDPNICKGPTFVCPSGYYNSSGSFCAEVYCPAGKYANGYQCANCPSGEDCGCKASFGSNSVSTGSGSCGCPASFNFTCSPGNQQNYSKCACDPCPAGQNCDCSYRYGTGYVANGSGGCKAPTCPSGQKYVSNGGCRPYGYTSTGYRCLSSSECSSTWCVPGSQGSVCGY